MRNASFVSDLKCSGCSRKLVKDGFLKCTRCDALVPATLGGKRIFCPNCSSPRVLLARYDEALCPESKNRCQNRRENKGTPMKLATKEEADMEKDVTAKEEELVSLGNQSEDVLDKIRLLEEEITILGNLPLGFGRYGDLEGEERQKLLRQRRDKLRQAVELREQLQLKYLALTKPSKTQELRDRLDAGIQRNQTSEAILQDALKAQFPTMIPRYLGLTHDELDAMKENDHKKIEEIRQRLNLLRSARELDVDIDALEEMGLTIETPNSLYDPYICFPYPFQILMPEAAKIHVTFQDPYKPQRSFGFAFYLGQRRLILRVGTHSDILRSEYHIKGIRKFLPKTWSQQLLWEYSDSDDRDSITHNIRVDFPKPGQDVAIVVAQA